MRRAAAYARGVLVDVGCGKKPFVALFQPRVTTYVGLDYPETCIPLGGTRAEVFGTASQLPLRSSTADTVLLTEVLEHVAEPLVVLSELHRVLKPGGVLLLTAPMSSTHSKASSRTCANTYWYVPTR